MVLKWQMRWAAHLKGCVLTASLKGTYKPNSHTFLNAKPLLAVSGNQDIALSVSRLIRNKKRKKKKSMSVPQFMPLQSEKRSQISSAGTCVETQLFRPACWHLARSASSIYALMISLRTFQVARPLCNVWNTTCSHAITPAAVLSRCKWRHRMTFQSLCCWQPRGALAWRMWNLLWEAKYKKIQRSIHRPTVNWKMCPKVISKVFIPLN